MAAAIQITSPSKNDVVDLAAGVEVKWSTVNTDPDTAHLFLVNMASGHTPYSKDLGEVKLSSGSLVVSQKDVPEDGAFQFNFQSVKQNNMGILAQSEQFENKKEDDTDDELVVDSTTTKATSTTGGSKTTMTTATTTATTTGAEAEDTDDDDAEETTTSTGTASNTAAASTSTGAPESGAASVALKGGMLALVAGVLAVVA
ncbi:hypothetical protein QBC40DRAFT_183543 [Triangularia verruculosa]|uniref:Yeast cell wall synthesis Kre9/Knh1-like N-terminal domain-containing protein n=1 Tax=Triangularia verruculosa TaxID=2587418 RepID=A0AAN6X973_9PEZI|nr:hypothetical protein QBC40DRAFT_183543 [Triangularia verruculosa]